MRQIVFLDIHKQDVSIVISLIEKRLEVLRKRVLKVHGADWYDYDEARLKFQIGQKCNEFERLDLLLDTLYKSLSQS